MKNIIKDTIKELKIFIIFWSTQSLSQLGSAMTGFALTLWLYEQTGSALKTALLSICSYAPYVCMSIFAGALSDKWNKKKVMLICDTFAACCTVTVLILLKNGLLAPWHMYLLNVINGLMNTIQQPASDVALTLITPKKYYQRTSGLRSFSNSLITIFHPLFATSLFAFAGMDAVVFVDLATFFIAFLTLFFFVRIPEMREEALSEKESVLESSKIGLRYLRDNPMILTLILFLAGVNFAASAFDAVLPAYILPRKNGGEKVLGLVSSCAGAAMLVGSFVVTVLPKPGNRIRVIYLTMLFSLSVENFVLAFSREPVIWCLAQFIGWVVVPIMSANLDVILRSTIPVHLQGRVYSCRNTLQFFTIPIGQLFGGFMVDKVFEPIAASAAAGGMTAYVWGREKGSGAAIMMLALGIMGTLICLGFGRVLRKYNFVEQDSFDKS